MGRPLFWVLSFVAGLSACASVDRPGEGRLVLPASPSPRVLSETALRCFEGQAPTANGAERPLVTALLSPRMVYSLLEWPRMQREAEAAGYRVQAWRDPRVPLGEWQQAWASPAMHGWNGPLPQALPEACVAEWGPVNHVPLVRVVWMGRLHPWPAWGIMDREAWLATLALRRNGLADAMEAAK